VRIRPGASGTVFFTAQALTDLGTPVGDTASVNLATVIAAKPVVMRHEGVELRLPAQAVRSGQVLVLKGHAPSAGQTAVSTPTQQAELEMLWGADLFPIGLPLAMDGRLHFERELAPGDALYRRQAGRWEFIGLAPDLEAVRTLGRYAIMRDRLPPRVLREQIGAGKWQVSLQEDGSGLNPTNLLYQVNGKSGQGQLEGNIFYGRVPSNAASLRLEIQDRAGNLTSYEI
jgi:hypothetical protein